MPYRVTLEEVQRRTKEADDAKGDDAGVKDEPVPLLDSYSQQEHCDGCLARSDGSNQHGLADNLKLVGLCELCDFEFIHMYSESPTCRCSTSTAVGDEKKLVELSVQYFACILIHTYPAHKHKCIVPTKASFVETTSTP